MLRKSLLCLLSAICIAMPLSTTQACQSNDNTPEKPAIAFDIHGVLTKIAVWKMAKTIFWGLVEQPSRIWKLSPATFKNGAYGNDPFLQKIYNCHDPRPETWEVIRKLKEANYPLYTFSNITDTAFADFRKTLPGYFDTFDGCHLVQNNDPALRKPNPTAYDSCKKLIAQKHPNRPIIFVDDDSANIAAAQNAGMIGIHFSSAQRLEQELTNHNVVFPAAQAYNASRGNDKTK